MDTTNIMSQLNRSRGIGGSDAMRIARGEWRSLYNEKVGLTAPDDLSDVFKVQLGITTEPLHRRWFGKLTGFTIDDAPPFRQHATYEWMYANLDGWVQQQNTFVEFKHTNARATLREKARYYMPQLQHYLAVTEQAFCYFSIIKGNEDPEFCTIDRNETYIAELIDMEQSFWWHVQNRVPPEIEPTGKAEALAVEAANTLIDGLRTIDMAGSNEWAAHAASWLETREAAALNEQKAKEIKALVPEDAAEAYGYGVVVRRDKRGRLSLRQQKEEA